MFNARVVQRLDDRNISVGKFNVFANQRYLYRAVGIFNFVNHAPPFFKLGRSLRQIQLVEDDFIKPLAFHDKRHFINRFRRPIFYDCVFVHVAEQRDFFLKLTGYRIIRPANQNIRLNTNRPQFLDAVLSWLSLEFARRPDIRQKRHVNIKRVVFADFLFNLTNRLKERQAFNVADSAADLRYHNVSLISLRHGVHASFNFVGDVRNNLHRRAEIIALALLRQNSPINFARCGV